MNSAQHASQRLSQRSAVVIHRVRHFQHIFPHDSTRNPHVLRVSAVVKEQIVAKILLAAATVIAPEARRRIRRDDAHARVAKLAGDLKSDDPTVLAMLCAAHSVARDFQLASRLIEKAVALDPNSAWAWNRSGWLESYLDRVDTAIEHFERALRLSPFDPMNFNAFIGIGGAHFVAGRYAETVLWFEKGLLEQPSATWVYRNLVPTYALLGRDADARAALSRLLQEYPDLTISKIMSGFGFRNRLWIGWPRG